MKKTILILLSVITLFSITSCNSGSNNSREPENPVVTSETSLYGTWLITHIEDKEVGEMVNLEELVKLGEEKGSFIDISPNGTMSFRGPVKNQLNLRWPLLSTGIADYKQKAVRISLTKGDAKIGFMDILSLKGDKVQFRVYNREDSKEGKKIFCRRLTRTIR